MSRFLRLAPVRSLLFAAGLVAACKGGAGAAAGAGATAQAGGGQQGATWGGPAAPGGSGAQLRTDRPPELQYFDSLTARAEREFEVWAPGGSVTRIAEIAWSDGPDRRLVEVAGVWDEASQAWQAPTPLLAGLYPLRTAYLLGLRDLHLHARGVYANYRWVPQAGTVTLAGRSCEVTRAESLHGYGPVDLVHEVGTGLLLGWTVWDAAATQPVMRLTTTALDLQPNLSQVAWANDRLGEEIYQPAAHDALLRFTPRSVPVPPAGFFREKAVVYDVRGAAGGLSFVHAEHWSDGLRNLYVVQHATPQAQGGTPLNVAEVAREGGIVGVDATLPDRRVGAVGLLPERDVLMVIGGFAE